MKGPLAEEIIHTLGERIFHSATDDTHGHPATVSGASSLSSIFHTMRIDRLVSCLLHSLSDALISTDADDKADPLLERASVAIVGPRVPFHILDSDILQSLREKVFAKRVEGDETFALEDYLQARE